MNPVKLLSLLILNFLSVVLSEDDFHIDQFKSQHLQRLWGIPDTTSEIGHLFHYEIPKNAFYGNVARFKVSRNKLLFFSCYMTYLVLSGGMIH